MSSLKTSLFNTDNLSISNWDVTYYLKQTPTKGRLVYEYNPLHNYRLAKSESMPDDDTMYEDGSIVDLVTKHLNFDLNHPLEIECQDSYDGSVNLIFNDNIPRLINTRFSTLQNNTYEVVDRIGDNDTNIYDNTQFDRDTSLYKEVNHIPKIQFNGLLYHGNLKVGNYVIYIKYSDADDNETDFVGESGIISCFIGQNPKSVNGGYRDQNSLKSISLTIKDIDESYDYIKVWYTRATSDVDQNRYTTAYEIVKRFPIHNNQCDIIINGDEDIREQALSALNTKYFIASSIKTSTVCQNRLFIGNVETYIPDYEDLTDISLRICPYYTTREYKADFNELYEDLNNDNGYYNPHNIYNYVGYWPEEIYRFGIVYIMPNGQLSSVYNIVGTQDLTANSNTWPEYLKSHPVLDKDGNRIKIPVIEDNYSIDFKYNSKGVCKFPEDASNKTIYGISFYIPQDVINYLKDTNKIKGYFFVRQKRIPTILAQAYTLPVDNLSCLPMISSKIIGKDKRQNYIESFITKDRFLNNNYLERLYQCNNGRTQDFAAICPEYELFQSHYNQVFTGDSFKIKPLSYAEDGLIQSPFNYRHYYADKGDLLKNSSYYEGQVGAIPDGSPIVAFNNTKFRAMAGEANEAYKFRFITVENEQKDAYNLARGLFGSYIGIACKELTRDQLVNIYIPNYSIASISDYFKVRYEDSAPYYAIGNRYSILDSPNNITQYRGDCYICQFTHRLNRNFNDPQARYNDIIVDVNSWRDNYEYQNQAKLLKINRGDVNAVQLGSWITVTVRASSNLCLRSTDLSYPQEEGATGNPRGFYPLYGLSTDGNYKLPESGVLNGGYGSTVSERYNYTLPEVPYIKNKFFTRIAYSDISIGDAFKNGYRVFNATNYRDYTNNHGGLIKLETFNGNLIAVFEHAVALIPVNERAIAANGAGGDVFINTNNVLPQNPMMLSDIYGSQWQESIIRTTKYIYGVDTVAKKIWRTNGQMFQCISDFSIQKFLNDHISLSEFELTPIIGIRNVKTHFNAFKQDVMFTFYDNTRGLQEEAWNICWNENREKWITFYSWMPSYSANIDNIFFSFDRDTSKWITKLAQSSSNSNTADGITVQECCIDKWIPITKVKRKTKLSLVNRLLPENSTIKFELLKDIHNLYKYFRIDEIDGEYWLVNVRQITESLFYNPVIQLNIQCNITINYNTVSTNRQDYSNGWKEYLQYNIGNYQSKVTLTLDSIVQRKNLWYYDDNNQKQEVEGIKLLTNFWKHGQSGIIDIKDTIKPCFWYGKQHPFEFEVVVNAEPTLQKIFTNLQILSNNAEPDSFHYTINKDAYDFSEDIKNIYYRQEATKCLYQQLGSNIVYDQQYLKEANRDINHYLQQQPKSTVFPITYIKQDKLDEIYNTYLFSNDLYNSWQSLYNINRNYSHLSGTEVVYDNIADDYKLLLHSKGTDIKKIGRLHGNMNYLENMWDIQINSIIFAQKNEKQWLNSKPPITVIGALPTDIKIPNVSNEVFLNTDISSYNVDNIDVNNWGYRKETKLRDKYIKIRVRYSGTKFAIIHSLITTFNISYV